MQTVSTIGLDIAKSVFQVHGVDQIRSRCIFHDIIRDCPLFRAALRGRSAPRHPKGRLRHPEVHRGRSPAVFLDLELDLLTFIERP
jgi:hypothetical protein